MEAASATSLAALLKADVMTLAVDIGNRSVFAPEPRLPRAADAIAARLGAAGCTVSRQTFTSRGRTVSNIVGKRAGANPSLPYVLIGAHYDTCHSPGADDNASGVAAMLELAWRLKARTPPRSLRFVAFVNEEDPFWGTGQMGSLVCARAARTAEESIRLMLNLDMVGRYPNGQRYFLVGSNAASQTLANRTKELFVQGADLPTRYIPRSDPAIGDSDHWAFWHEGYPAVWLTGSSYDYDGHIHSSRDTWDKLNYNNMAEVVEGLEAVVLGL
jgi:Zn-dependent M28 family amino/carboxypeptidase